MEGGEGGGKGEGGSRMSIEGWGWVMSYKGQGETGKGGTNQIFLGHVN